MDWFDYLVAVILLWFVLNAIVAIYLWYKGG